MEKLRFLITLLMMSVGSMLIQVTAETASPTQTIRGKIVDAATSLPIPAATVALLENPTQGAVADENGDFAIENVRVGRYTLSAEMVGYSPVELKEQLVISGKELVVTIRMSEDLFSLDEVVVNVNKQMPNNTIATVGARMFSVEDISRTPGGVEDPARLASSYAGVSSDGATNGISIHGNAPHLLAWRIEGVEVPNPNHYADISVAGAGIFSSLSTKVMGNSDFFTSAFPSEYNNAISGIFDMKMRNGNPEKYEHTFQIGVLGIDAASEGPIGKDKKASYIFNYRYSFLGLATSLGFVDMGGQELKYQDLNFKINVPTKKAGTFSLWGTGLIDDFKKPMKKNVEDWDYLNDGNSNVANQYMLATGLTHLYLFESGAYLKTSVACSANKEKTSCDNYFRISENDARLSSNTFFETNNVNSNLILTSAFNKKYNSHFTNKSGFTLTRLASDMNIKRSELYTSPMLQLVDTDNSTLWATLFTNNQLNYGAFTLNLGLAYQYLALNSAYSLEPRVGIEYALNKRARLALGYGLHSRKERTDIYFVEIGGKRVNEDLGFTKAHHVMTSFSYKLNENALLKIEPYFQYLYDVPVEYGSGFSMVNNVDFIVDHDLDPDGKGRNYGVDVTLERYLHNGWFGMVTGSFFSSKFQASDGNWYHSRYDRNYIVNFIAGKEWMVGKSKSNIINAGAKYTLQGPERTTPIDYVASEAHPEHSVQYDETKMFTERLKMKPVFALSFNYKINKEKLSHTFVLDFVYSSAYYGYEYNIRNNTYDDVVVNLTFPQVAYKIEF